MNEMSCCNFQERNISCLCLHISLENAVVKFLYFQVILKVDTVTLTVFMSTGTLMIQGNLVLDWFLRHFQCIMDHYDAPVAEPKPDTSVFRQYTENWKKLEDHYSIKKGFDHYHLTKDIAVHKAHFTIIFFLISPKTTYFVDAHEKASYLQRPYS